MIEAPSEGRESLGKTCVRMFNCPKTMSQPMLEIDKYRAVARQNNLGNVISVEEVKRENDIVRMVTCDGVYYCKTYTKGWYGPAEENSYPVLHESGAYAALKAHGLSTPEVVRAEPSKENALGMPYLLLKALDGVTIGQSLSKGEDIEPLLCLAGDYLRRMHSIQFQYAGYVSSVEGPTQVPRPDGWRHGHWAGDALEEIAKKRWDDRREQLGDNLHRNLFDLFESNRSAFEADYTPPRMLHGDCHVDQFFFSAGQVTGVVDMEVASSGAPIGDLVKFSIEASSKLSSIDWWQPFFHGYGQSPNFDVFKLRLLCCEEAEFKWQGWQGEYAEIIRRLMKANTWASLFACACEERAEP